MISKELSSFEELGDEIMTEEDFFFETLMNDEVSYKTDFPFGLAGVPASLETYWLKKLGVDVMSALRVRKKPIAKIKSGRLQCPVRGGIEVLVGMNREGTTLFCSPRKVRFFLHTLSDRDVFFKCVLEYNTQAQELDAYVRNVFWYDEGPREPSHVSLIDEVMAAFHQLPVAKVINGEGRGEYYQMEYLSYKYGTFPFRFKKETYYSEDQASSQVAICGSLVFDDSLVGVEFVRNVSMYVYNKVVIHLKVQIERRRIFAYVFDHEMGVYHSVDLNPSQTIYDTYGVKIHLGLYDCWRKTISLAKPAMERTYPSSLKYYRKLLQLCPQTFDEAQQNKLDLVRTMFEDGEDEGRCREFID